MSKEYVPHTPGPWQVHPQAPFVVIHGPVQLGKPGSCVQPGVAVIETDGQRGMADARLIAAAPEILKACEDYLYGRKDARECESEMRAAIAKARGART